MNMQLEGKVYPPYRLKPDRALAAKMLAGQGLADAPTTVPPTYFIFLRGETRGVDLFTDLDIPREKALHAGQRYEWLAPIGWDDEVEVTARIASLAEKQGKGGKLWFADVEYEYRLLPARTLALRETTRLVKRG
ncbi:MAG TPA: MaoC family dehydratase N-terminal domain-containing protein [Alphaproteobacteria bacterium]